MAYDIKSILAKPGVTRGNNTPVGAAGDANVGDAKASPRVAAMRRRMSKRLQKKEEK